jgi:hypothetical protein
MVGVSGSYQNYQNEAVSNQLADVGRGWGGGGSVLGVTVNLLMCDRGGALYSVLEFSNNLWGLGTE